MTRFLTYLYILILPFTSAFALTEVITPSLLILLALSALFIFGFILRVRSFTINYIDIAILLFWIAVVSSFFLNSNLFLSGKPLNHLVAYSFVILANYYMLRNILADQIEKGEITFDRVIYLIGIGVLITSLFGIVEFITKNIYFFDIDQYVPRVSVEGYRPFASSFIRIRSFIIESGHLAFYYELLGPIGLYGLRRNRPLFIITLVTMLLCFIFSFSSAGWIISGAIAFIVWLRKTVSRLLDVNKKIKIFQFIFTVIFGVAAVIGLYYFYQTVGSQIVEATVYDKVTASGSANDRSERAIQVLTTLYNTNPFHILFGYGPAAYNSLRYDEAALVLYFTFWLESGVLGLALFLIFILFSLIQINSIKDEDLRTIFLCSITAALIHFVFISNYWYPWFWTLLILSQIASSRTENPGRTETA